jgi:hypothetical protein
LAVVLDLLVSILTGVSLLFMLYFAWKAFTAYSRTSNETYGVGQQRAKQSMQVNAVWSLLLLVIALILWGVSGLGLGPAEAEILPPVATTPASDAPATEPTTAVNPLTTNTPTPTLAPLVTIASDVTITTTDVAAPATLTPAPLGPSPTPINSPQTAVVSSGVGVWLRAQPSTTGEQLEWLLDGTVVTVLPEIQQADEFEWQQVRTLGDQVGWVATDFIVYNNQ